MDRSEIDSELDALLEFCHAAGVIHGYERIRGRIAVHTGMEIWTLSSEEASLFLLGALKYRPDLLHGWKSLSRMDRQPGAQGLAA